MDKSLHIKENNSSTPEQLLSVEVEHFATTTEWRANPDISEMRSVLRTPVEDIPKSLTATTLAGGNMISVPPYVFIDDAQGCLNAFYYLGSNLAGHSGMLHGGLFAVLLDECMGRASFAVLPNHIGVTASMEIAYLAPVKIPAVLVINAFVEKIDGRKAWVVATMGSSDGRTIYARAKALFIEPRHAETMQPLI